MARPHPPAALSAELIQIPPGVPSSDVENFGAPSREASWRQDARLFAVTWAAGFVFFLAYLS